jgi:hypothetical protein
VTVTFTGGDLLDTTPDTDVLLAGDVFYDRDMAARVEPFLLAAHRRGTLVLVGDPQRSFMPKGWTRVDTFPVPVPPNLEGVAVKTTTVWRPAPDQPTTPATPALTATPPSRHPDRSRTGDTTPTHRARVTPTAWSP